jgi:hypothetical protein
MDREAVVVRAEMSRTRAELDRKITQLEARVREFTPHHLKERYVSEFFVDRLIGGILTLVGLRLAWGMYRQRHSHHRDDVRAMATAYGRW